MYTSCFFTGHRILKYTNELEKELERTLTELINDGVTDFYAGGALGWDTICANMVLNLKKSFPHIKLHLILPCSPDEQCKKWDSDQKAEYYKIYDLADSAEALSVKYYDGCMKKRNARLTELGSICVCYWNGEHRGGTFQTINMAVGKIKRTINLFKSN